MVSFLPEMSASENGRIAPTMRTGRPAPHRMFIVNPEIRRKSFSDEVTEAQRVGG